MLDEQSELLKLRILNNKLKAHEFVENEKINEIRRNNQLLLDRLLDISKGKWAAPGMKAKVVRKRMGPKSLNYVTKKRELERIDNENLKLMNRIVNQSPMLNTKKFEQEYRDRRRLQKSLQRNKLIPIKNLLKKKKRVNERSTGRLPPLQNAGTPSMKDGGERVKLPQTVSSSKKRQNTFEDEEETESNHKQVITTDNEKRVNKTPKDKQNPATTTRNQAKPAPVSKGGFVSAT